MKIALFSDIHGNITGLKAVLAALDRLGGADLVFAAGDLIGGGPGTDEVIDLLTTRAVRMVRGDSDTEDKLLDRLRAATSPQEPGRLPARYGAPYYEAMLSWMRASLSESGRAFLAALPLSETVEVAPGHRLFVCHASPRDAGERVCGAQNTAASLREAYGSVQADVIAFGHAHTPYVRLFDGKLMVNVASVAFRPDATSVLTLVTYDDEQWVVEQHAIAYDAAEEARLMAERAVPTAAPAGCLAPPASSRRRAGGG
jgi:predicted phosphodiesterase